MYVPKKCIKIFSSVSMKFKVPQKINFPVFKFDDNTLI